MYSYTLTMEEASSAEFKVLYTVSAEQTVPGNQTLTVNGETVSGQAVTSYTYAFPLNYKNIVCIWAFIWMIGLIILELVSEDNILQSKWLVKVEGLLTKYQIPILLLELLVIVLLLVRISRNEAVHWDEAYTWKMVTKNNLNQMFQATAADVHPPLYYMMVMGAMRIFGKSIFVAKMVSVAGAVATGILGITLVRKHWGVKAAIPFVLAAGLGPQLVYYNLDVRMYSWMSFFVIAAGLFAYEILKTGKLCWWVAFTLVSLGGVYTQYFAVVPLVLIYLYLMIEIIVHDRKQLKKWIICCIATVIGYLPWFTVVIETLQRDARNAKGEKIILDFHMLCKWAFETNIRLSEYMPLILFIVAFVCLLVERKKYSTKAWKFVVFTGIIIFLSVGICVGLTSIINHFWSNRYLTDLLLFVWLFLAIALAQRNLLSWGAGMVWLGVMMLSSYTCMQATELNTIPWIQDAKQILQEVQGAEKVVYTFPTYDVLYEYYLPDTEFIYYEDVDFDTWDQEEFYMISWGPNDFPYYLYSNFVLRKQVIGNMRFEEGIYAELWKIQFTEIK